MFTSIYSGAVCGIEGQLVSVEADISDGFPSYCLVGYLASEVKEARERVAAALKNSGYRMPAKKIIINLSPAGMRKQGTAYDLPIALALLGSLGIIPRNRLAHVFAVGELSLDGSLKPVKGVLSLVLMAGKSGITRCLVPEENVAEAELARDQWTHLPEIIGLSDLNAACIYLCQGMSLPSDRNNRSILRNNSDSENQSIIKDSTGITVLKKQKNWVDFSQIIGQEPLKRAIMAAIAGMHHLLMIGPPGSGKSMSAQAIRGILPPMTRSEQLEVTQIYSVAGLLENEGRLMEHRPFRSPHHTVPVKTMTGGGAVPVPGEISLAHRGILFLDELAEFAPSTLEVLRQPLEEGIITINRLHGSFVFPASFMLIAAMNPCKCGYFPNRSRCRCSSQEVYRYLHRISRPLWNRIDLCVEVHPPIEPGNGYSHLLNRKKQENIGTVTGETALDSRSMAGIVLRARKIQEERFKGQGIFYNSHMSAEMMERYCFSDAHIRSYAGKLADAMDLNMRGFHKMMKVARTIADLDGEKEILEEHVDEAAAYRMVEQSYWEL